MMRRSPIRTVRPLRRAMVGTVALLMTVVTAAAAAPAPGGQEGIDSRNSGQAAGPGPDSPGLLWTSELLEHRQLPADHALILDSEGHVLVQVRRFPEGGGTVESLVAVDRTDGSIAWELDDIENSCDVAATDEGVIYAQLKARSASNDTPSTDLVGIDAATGELIPGLRYSPPETVDEPRLAPCWDGLRLLPDGTVILAERLQTGGESVRAVGRTPDGDALEQMWLTRFTEAHNITGRPPVSPDGTAIYVSWTTLDSDPREPRVSRVDAATGAIETSVSLPGGQFTISNRQADAFLVDPAGGVVVNTREHQTQDPQRAWVTRLDENLHVSWQLEIPEDDPDFPDALGFYSMVATGDQLVGWYRGHRIASLDTATGALNWMLRPGSFSNNESRIVADGQGNTYWSTFGDNYLESADADGSLRWVLEQCALGTPGEAAIVGPIDDGVLYAARRIPVSGDTDHLVIDAFSGDADIPQGDCEGEPEPEPEPEPDGAERISGVNRVETAVRVSQTSFVPDDSADAVVLAVSTNYPDALAGGPLARKVDGPLLLTGRDTLDSRTRTEIERLGARTAYLLGGTAALSNNVESTLQAMGLQTIRLAGANRFDTARLVAQRVPSTTVYVTEGANANPARGWPDAVAVSGLASFEERPILLVTRDQAPPDTLRALQSLGATNVVVVGGEAAVSRAVATRLADYDNDGTVEAQVARESGASRFATSVAVARRSVRAGASTEDLWFATGLAFPDALTAGPAAAKSGGVLLLVHGQSTSGGREVHTWLEGLSESEVARAWFVGGTSAISNAVANALAEAAGVQ
jgi:putative cell wall-binding protein/outer membrane protein assembly factor BamB